MTLRSTLDIDVKDERFQQFQEKFEKYRADLAKLPGAWASVDKNMKSSFEHVAAALLAQNELASSGKKTQEEMKKAAGKTADFWKGMAVTTKSVASHIKDATASLLRWTSLASVASGLLGGGGLFGLDLLAAGVGSTRRQSLGLGVSFGEQRAFGLNFGRLVDSDSYLSNVNAAMHDVTKRYALYGAGLTENQIKGKDTAQLAATLLPQLKKLADRTPPELLGQTLRARGLDQFISLQDFERLRNTSAGEIADYSKQYGQDVKSFGLDDRSARAWQALDVQLSRAGQKIENVFIRGLEPLIPSLTKFSDAVASALRSFLDNPKLKDFIKEAGDGIENFAKYINSPKFQADLRSFSDDVAGVAEGLANALRWLGLLPDKEAQRLKAMGIEKHKGSLPFTTYYTGKSGNLNKALGGQSSFWDRPFADVARETLMHWLGVDNVGVGSRSVNNPGNLRPMSGKGFLQFRTAEDGLRAMARQLTIYQDKHGLDTIAGIVSRYAPPKDHNNTAAYIQDVADRTKFGAGQHLNLHDQTTLAKLVAAMTKHENFKTNYTPKTVIEVLNNTGGSAVVASNQAAKS